MTLSSPPRGSLDTAFSGFHERNFMCPEQDCEWGVIETGEFDPITTLPITRSCGVCRGLGFLPRKAA